jgi:hypothetical protein
VRAPNGSHGALALASLSGQRHWKAGMWSAIVLVVGIIAVWIILTALMRDANKH